VKRSASHKRHPALLQRRSASGTAHAERRFLRLHTHAADATGFDNEVTNEQFGIGLSWLLKSSTHEETRTMKRSQFTEEQILYALRQVEAGTPPADVCRQPRVQLSELLHLEKALRQPGPHRAERAAAAARREHTAEAPGRRSHARQAHPGGGSAKKALKPTRRRELARWMRAQFQIAVIRSCRLAGLSRAAWYSVAWRRISRH
jgi:hypothetical protein